MTELYQEQERLRGLVTKMCLVKGYFQDNGKGSEALARTQVYLSKTKLRVYR